MNGLAFYGGHDASVCILKNGSIALHLELERITRVKSQTGAELTSARHAGRPWAERGIAAFIDMALVEEGLAWRDLDFIAVLPDGIDMNRDDLHLRGDKPVYVVNHHEAHAASTFYPSPFAEAAVLTLDGGGNDGGGLIGLGRGPSIDVARRVPNGALGILWEQAMRFWSDSPLGPIGTEGVLMGAAAYAEPHPPLVDYFIARVRELAAIETSTIGTRVRAMLLDVLEPGHPMLPRRFSVDSEESYFTFCASLQQATECLFDDYFAEVDERYGAMPLCLAGGVTLNCNALGKSLLKSPRPVYSCAAPSDAGLTIGALLWVQHQILGVPREPSSVASPYLGLRHDRHDYVAMLRALPELDAEPATVDRVVDLLREGAVVALFEGRSESGRRALGNRSIVADPRPAGVRERLNREIKHRQWYRPFAPSVLREEVVTIFGRELDSPYMSYALPMEPAWRERVPAVVHRDGTARLQTVTQELNPFYHSLISCFHARTGVPLLLNTSFNDSEPIVETPEDALRCFLRTGIDYLYIGGYLVRRREA